MMLSLDFGVTTHHTSISALNSENSDSDIPELFTSEPANVLEWHLLNRVVQILRPAALNKHHGGTQDDTRGLWARM